MIASLMIVKPLIFIIILLFANVIGFLIVCILIDEARFNQKLMDKFSIVIVAKDAADKISRLLESIKGLSDDVIVCDTGSTDDTRNIAQHMGASLHTIRWEGYGKSKNNAI